MAIVVSASHTETAQRITDTSAVPGVLKKHGGWGSCACDTGIWIVYDQITVLGYSQQLLAPPPSRTAGLMKYSG